jgi:hypothetical protein
LVAGPLADDQSTESEMSRVADALSELAPAAPGDSADADPPGA